MATKLLNNRTKELFWSLIIIEALSFWLWNIPSLANIFFLILIAGALIISFYRLEWGIYIILTELFIGSQGHIIDFHINGYNLSLRIGLFVMVFIAMLYHAYKKRDLQLFKFLDKKWLILFGVLVIFGIVQGIINNGFVNTYFDANGYLYLLLWPAFILIFNSNFLLNIFRILLVCINWLALKTYLILFAFAHGISWLDLDLIYRWIRDQRFGEITYVSNNFYRIFIQSQVYAAVGLIIILLFIYFKTKAKIQIKDQWYLYLTLFTSTAIVLASFSRSYWVGVLGTLLILSIIFLYQKLLNWKAYLKTISIFVLGLILSIVFLFTWTGSWQTTDLSDRALNINDSALSSRQAQLKPLSLSIGQNPYFGYGFGKEISYRSDDPRIKNELNPTGKYTTYAFEWGYLDIILKLGFFGFFAYLAVIIAIYQKNALQARNGAKIDILKLGFTYSIILICIINIFSPYLNHPLGIGLLLINFYHEQ